MIGLLVFWIWFGGVAAAYGVNRKAGAGRFIAGGVALLWPVGLGIYIAENFSVYPDHQPTPPRQPEGKT